MNRFVTVGLLSILEHVLYLCLQNCVIQKIKKPLLTERRGLPHKKNYNRQPRYPYVFRTGGFAS
jgi:hypothetical protein